MLLTLICIMLYWATLALFLFTFRSQITPRLPLYETLLLGGIHAVFWCFDSGERFIYSCHTLIFIRATSAFKLLAFPAQNEKIQAGPAETVDRFSHSSGGSSCILILALTPSGCAFTCQQREVLLCFEECGSLLITSQLSSGRSWCQNGQEGADSSVYHTLVFPRQLPLAVMNTQTIAGLQVNAQPCQQGLPNTFGRTYSKAMPSSSGFSIAATVPSFFFAKGVFSVYSTDAHQRHSCSCQLHTG